MKGEGVASPSAFARPATHSVVCRQALARKSSIFQRVGDFFRAKPDKAAVEAKQQQDQKDGERVVSIIMRA